ncbi:MAG: RelA/SpoT family protein [Nitrospiria bacterium]
MNLSIRKLQRDSRRFSSARDLIKRIRVYTPNADEALLIKAYAFADKAHKGQRRRSGAPYLQHPVEVADILTQLKLDPSSVVAGLLHDVVEDTPHSSEELRREFGEGIASLVAGVTKIGKIVFRNDQEKQAENFRKMIVSMTSDIRVLLIKLADRLHNMRTLDALPLEKQERIARETLEIYAPLANRLGIGWLKSELEDLCLRALNPDVHQTLLKKVKSSRKQRNKYIQSVVERVEKELSGKGFDYQVTGRSKHLFGIYHKMERQGIPFEEVFDLMGVRILTDTLMSCYGVLGLIHSLWRPVPGRFKDYIAIPKSNFYQSLHTTVIGPEGKHVEFQIRTREMHRIAEEGIAAHWVYKDGGKVSAKDEKGFAWLRQLMEWQRDLVDTRQFMSSVKTDLFSDTVYAFSPKGDLIELVRGSTSIDFAYAIHTEIGNHCIGSKINGVIAPLRTSLKNGDTVEILTSATQKPSRDWLKITKTSKAKAQIKHVVIKEERKKSLEMGRKILERELRAGGLSPSEVMKSDEIWQAFNDQNIRSLDELFIALGYGKIAAKQVVRTFMPKPAMKEGIADKLIKKTRFGRSEVKVKGIGDVLINFSKCCNPVPGEQIIGYITRGRGLSIHTVDCLNIDELDYNHERLVAVDWDKKTRPTHLINISVITINQRGLLASVSSAISGTGANITHAEIKTTEDQKANFHLSVEIEDIKHLKKVLTKISSLEGVLQARRIRKN